MSKLIVTNVLIVVEGFLVGQLLVDVGEILLDHTRIHKGREPILKVMYDQSSPKGRPSYTTYLQQGRRTLPRVDKRPDADVRTNNQGSSTITIRVWRVDERHSNRGKYCCL